MALALALVLALAIAIAMALALVLAAPPSAADSIHGAGCFSKNACRPDCASCPARTRAINSQV
jgi:hypothetical protein